MKKICLVALSILNCISILFSQDSKRTNVWYFGRNAGIDFNTSPPTPLLDGALNIWEGCATICDTMGQIMIYTDGRKIWNENHQVIPGANNLGGDNSATQSGIIVPKPGSDNLLYVFSVDSQGGSGGLRYAIIDMTQNGGLGGLVSSNNILLNQCSEKVTVIPHCNKQDIWLIAHGYGNNDFLVWKITSLGISSSPNALSVGSVHSTTLGGAVGYLKSSPDGSKLALGVQGDHFFELFDFDNETGEITNPITFSNSQIAKSYGVEFSPNGKRLYLAGTQTSPILFQVNLDLPTVQEIQNSLTVVGRGTSSYFGAIQNAPNGKIYIAKDNSEFLSVIHNPDSLDTACTFIEDDFYLGGRESAIGLPNLIPSYFEKEVEIEIIETYDYEFCDGIAELQAIANIEGDSIVYQWYFENDLIPNQSTTRIQVDLSGEYEFRAIVYFDCQSFSTEYSQKINVQIPETLSFQDVLLNHPFCGAANGSIVIEISGGMPPFQYSFDGGIFQSINSLGGLESGQYHLVVQDVNGCEISQSVELESANAPEITDIQITDSSCGEANGAIRIMSTGGTGQLEYSIDGQVFQEFQEFNDLIAGEYSVYVRDENGCLSTYEIELGNSPRIAMTSINIIPAVCGEANGSLSIEIEGGIGQIEVLLNDVFQSNFEFNGLNADTYHLSISDEVGCKVDTMITVNQRSSCPIYIPNVFSPNNDGLNDVFQIYSKTGFDAVVKSYLIFDRWGENIYEAKDFPANSSNYWWDGTFKKKKLDSGVYVYYIEVEFENGEKEIFEGDVSIIK